MRWKKLKDQRNEGVLPATAPRSPRVLLNKININEGVLERLRKIKKLARESMLTTTAFGREKPADKNELAKEASKSNTEATQVKEGTAEASFSRTRIGLGLDSAKTRPDFSEGCLGNAPVDQDTIKIFSSVNSNESKEETIEVLDTSERWMQTGVLKERAGKRKRDQNSNESIKDVCVVKIAKLYDDESVAKAATQSSCLSVAGTTRIVEGTVGEGHDIGGSGADRVPSKECPHPMGVQNKTELSTASNQEIQKKKISSNTRTRDQTNELNTQTNDETSRSNAQGKEVEVAKVAQDYAKSGAQPEKTKDLQSKSTETTTRLHPGLCKIFIIITTTIIITISITTIIITISISIIIITISITIIITIISFTIIIITIIITTTTITTIVITTSTKMTNNNIIVIIITGLLLKDVIEKRTKHFEDNLLQENAKLENRVERLERENALLQRTSKRLHLALQKVFKNREKPPHLIPGNVPQRHQGPVVVYQPGTLEGTGIRPGVPPPVRSFESVNGEKGPPFYVVIRATRKSSYSTFSMLGLVELKAYFKCNGEKGPPFYVVIRATRKSSYSTFSMLGLVELTASFKCNGEKGPPFYVVIRATRKSRYGTFSMLGLVELTASFKCNGEKGPPFYVVIRATRKSSYSTFSMLGLVELTASFKCNGEKGPPFYLVIRATRKSSYSTFSMLGLVELTASFKCNGEKGPPFYVVIRATRKSSYSTFSMLGLVELTASFKCNGEKGPPFYVVIRATRKSSYGTFSMLGLVGIYSIF
ncbi:hypothetical protein QZH41_012256 [Actinostola sp. cb2023]|nr:hypothetical protein QZH41_012256 [Actinostola sp. cb2023]